MKCYVQISSAYDQPLFYKRQHLLRYLCSHQVDHTMLQTLEEVKYLFPCISLSAELYTIHSFVPV